MPPLRRVRLGVMVGLTVVGSAHAAAPLRILSVDPSPAVNLSAPALRVTVAEDVSWGTTPCAPPRASGVCPRSAPPRAATTIGFAGSAAGATITGDVQHVPTAWLVVVDAGAPIAPRWRDVRTAAFAWLDEVPREGDKVAVIVLGETRHVSRTPWFSFDERARATDALGFQSLPLMALGRDEGLGTVFRAAVAEAIRDIPTIPTAADVPRVVVGLFSDGRTRTAQSALEAKLQSGRAAKLPPIARTRSFEVEAFWFPHDLADPRADGSGGMLDVTRDRGVVTRIDGATRESLVREAARRARGPSDRARSVLVEAAEQSFFPEVPALELRDDRGSVVETTGTLTMPLEREAWPLPRVTVTVDDLPNLAFAPPLRDPVEPPRRWRAFWLPTSEAARVAPPSGAPVSRANVEELVATDRELTLTASGALLRTRLDSAAMLERASGPLAIVVYDDTTGRVTPMGTAEAPIVPQGTWTAPLVDGFRVLRLGLLVASLLGLSVLVRWRKRRAFAQ